MEKTGNEKSNRRRIHLLDEIRGFAVICMVFYHGFFILGELFDSQWGFYLYNFFTPFEPFFAALFIGVCGVSCSLSHSNFLRGLKIAAAAVVISLVTCIVMPEMGFDGFQIYFGILHFLGAAILLYAVTKKLADKVSPGVGVAVCAVLYPFFSHIERGYLSYGQLITVTLPDKLYQSDVLMPLGIYSPDFASADYFPLLPDIFIFFAGVYIGRALIRKGFPKFSYKKRIAPFGWCGRHAFLIYIAHMPIIIGVAYAVEFVLNLIR